MNRRRLLTLAGALGVGALLPGCTSGWRGPGADGGQLADAVVPSPGAETAALASPIGQFALDLSRRLAPTTQNLVWSPWSVAMVLAMVRDGATGRTASEMTAVLRAGDDFDARLADGWRRMAHAPGEPLHAANAVWAQSGYPWKPAFLGKLESLSATLKLWDFAADAQAAAPVVNSWISGHTVGKITRLLKEGYLDPRVRMILVNALHFKAAWFEQLTDAPAGRFATPKGPVDTPYLWPGEILAGWRGTSWTSAALPCKDNGFELVMALPDDPKINPMQLPLDAFLQPVSGGVGVMLTLPPWKARQQVRLNQLLSAAGMPTAFDPAGAEFSGMTDAERLYVSLVCHEAGIEVNAHGIEAVAATVAVVREVSGRAAEPVTLTLDRPFAYALVHAATKTPLFIGQVADPTAES